MRNRCYVLNVLNTKTQGVQGTDGRLSARAWPAYAYVHVLHAEVQRGTASFFRCDLCSERRRLARTTKSATTRGRPRERIALAIGDRDYRVVEGSMDVRNSINNMHFDLLAFWGICHIRVQLNPAYRLIGRRGPLRVRALVRVRCPRNGKPRR